MPQVRRLVVAELLRPHDALQLRVEVGEEIGVAEQHPVEENDVVDLHGAEDAQEPPEERPEAEAPPDAVPHRQRRRPQEEEQGQGRQHPADGMGAGEALLPVRDGVQVLLRRRAEKALVLKKPTPAYSSRKYAAKTISAGRTVPLIAIPLPSFPETARYSWIFSSMSRSGSSRGLLRAAAA